MFRYPGLYKAGISVASVPDQRLYDTIYQERYMGLPDDNADGYNNSSPITFSKDLEGRLLVAHNKPFAMMSYPNRSHGISEGRGTTLHLYSMFTRFLHENLPAGGRSR